MTKKELINIASIKDLSAVAQKLRGEGGSLSQQQALVIANALIDLDSRLKEIEL